jgi:hypothetical protein
MSGSERATRRLGLDFRFTHQRRRLLVLRVRTQRLLQVLPGEVMAPLAQIGTAPINEGEFPIGIGKAAPLSGPG